MSYTVSRRGLITGFATLPALSGARPVWAQAGNPGAGLLARLRAAKSVTLGTANFPPYSGINLDGSLTGVVPALTKVILERLGISEIKAVAATYGELIPGMMAGRWDFISTALTITKARCAQVVYADPMVFDGASFVSMKDQLKNPPKLISELAAQKLTVGVSTGGALARIALAAGVSPGNLRQLPDNAALIDALIAQQIQIVLQDNAGIKHVYDQRKLPVDVTYPIADAPKHQSGCAFRKTDGDLLEAFQKEFRGMKASGQYLEISRQYDFDPTPEMATVTAEAACANSE
jgi:polar amino acid transport system substrate-binding protein